MHHACRPFLPAEHITLVGPQPVTGIVVRVDPLRTLIATDELNTVAVPNKLIADMVVINRCARACIWLV